MSYADRSTRPITQRRIIVCCACGQRTNWAATNSWPWWAPCRRSSPAGVRLEGEWTSPQIRAAVPRRHGDAGQPASVRRSSATWAAAWIKGVGPVTAKRIVDTSARNARHPRPRPGACWRCRRGQHRADDRRAGSSSGRSRVMLFLQAQDHHRAGKAENLRPTATRRSRSSAATLGWRKTSSGSGSGPPVIRRTWACPSMPGPHRGASPSRSASDGQRSRLPAPRH